MKRICVFVFLFILGIASIAQELKPNRTFVNYFYDAEAYMYEANHEMALDLLLKLEEIDPDNPNLWYKIGYCYLKTRLYKYKAEDYLVKAVDYASVDYKPDNHKERKTPLETYLYLADAYRTNYKFELSLQTINELRAKLNPENKDDKFLLDLADREEEITNNAIYNCEHPVDAKLINMGKVINSKYADHSPIIDISEKTLIFTSKRPKEGEELTNQDEDIFISKRNSTTKEWSTPVRLTEPVNTEINNEAAIGITIDGKKMVFFRSGMNNAGNVFLTERKMGDTWSNPKYLREDINTKSRETHAVISPDENSIYFTSNRKSGYGGYDIYVIRKLPNGKWSSPKALPEQINTPYDEETPFIHPDGVTFFFSSCGHSTMGKYDVFYSTMSKDGTFSEPVNLGYPINTPDDDVSYVMNIDGTKGYIATVKKDSYGDLDIYEIAQSGIYKNDMIVVYEGKVKSIDNEQIDGVIISIRDVETKEFVGIYRQDNADKTYSAVLDPNKTYEITYEAKGYFPQVVEYSPTDEDVYKYNKNYIPIELNSVLLEPYSLHDIVYFDENSSDLDDEAIAVLNKIKSEIDELKQDTGRLVINITLPIINANPELDNKSAESIIDYLTSVGFSKDDIYLNGKYPKDYQVFYGIDVKRRTGLLADSDLPVTEKEVIPEDIVIIENVLFDFDKYFIRKEHFENLNILAKYMNDNPNARIEISGHTDWYGTNEYNYLLSYRRSKVVKDYLVEKGNNPENIITSKYGEDDPIARNSNDDGSDNPVGRQFNRRSEFKVLKQGTTSLLKVKPLDVSSSLSNVDVGYNSNTDGSNNVNGEQKADENVKYTIQVFALRHKKDVSEFADLVGVKIHVSDGWYRYYVGEFNSKHEAKQAMGNLINMGYEPFIRKLSFFEK